MSTTKLSLKEAIEIANIMDLKKESVSFRCDVRTINNLQIYSKSQGISLSSLINQICTDFSHKHIENITETSIEYPHMSIKDKIELLKNMINAEEERIAEINETLTIMKDEVTREELKL